MTTTMGTPISALRSVPRRTLAMSPNRLSNNITTANQYPHLAPRHKPAAVKAHARQTTDMSTNDHRPILANPSCARGLSFQIGSRKLPGKASATKEMRLAAVPTRNSRVRAVIPVGRVAELVLIALSLWPTVADSLAKPQEFLQRRKVNGNCAWLHVQVPGKACNDALK